MALTKTYVHPILNTVNDPTNLVHNQWRDKSFKLENIKNSHLQDMKLVEMKTVGTYIKDAHCAGYAPCVNAVY